MGFFLQLTDAIASRHSLLVAGLDPNPEMLQSWALRRGMGGRSFLSQARHWIKAVIEATAPHVCAYKPSLGFYQALGSTGLELLREVRELVPLDLPLIVDAKHGDLNSSSALAHYLFRELGADAVTVNPLAGQDIAAPFLLYPEKAVVV
ncbi:MAG: orotidine 5'-phosphate decarboxylase / HUMPS family protein, partial [Synechococcaceae cyanobacterium]|nr:orotidine 5'-phosphate decarboxylase / HUMPS family protein [Synechococcaceae cyanobacterium]